LFQLLKQASPEESVAAPPPPEDVQDVPVDKGCQVEPVALDFGCQVRMSYRSKSVWCHPEMVTIATQTDEKDQKQTSTQTETTFEDDHPIITSTPVKKRQPPMSPGYQPNSSYDMTSDSCADTTLDTSCEDRKDNGKAKTFTPSTPAEYAQETKYIVFEHKLLQLFKICPGCHDNQCEARVDDTVAQGHGTMVRIEKKCGSCPLRSTWDSQPTMNKIPVGNLILSGAILTSGSQVAQVLRMLKIMHVKAFSSSTFFRQQSKYVFPTIVNTWRQQQRELIADLEQHEGGVHVAGDCRNDSPGHCAKYGVYTLIEQTTKKVLDLQVVQSNEAGNSNACELVGFKRAISFLTETHNVHLATIVTDRHLSIAAHIRDEVIPNNPNCLNLKHYNDVWHVAKGLRKKLQAKTMHLPDAQGWIRSAVNHMYFVAAHAQVEGFDDAYGQHYTREDVIEDMWKSLDNHIHDVHRHHSLVYPHCLHGPLDPGPNRSNVWLQRGSRESGIFTEVLSNKRLLKDIKKCSPAYQTSSLEAFHSLLLKFTPKHTHFSWLGMITRSYLAALHHNENANRLQAVNQDGSLQYRVVFPKAKKGGHTVQEVKTVYTIEYAHSIMISLLEGVAAGPADLRESIRELRDEEPQPLSSEMVHPDKDDAIEGHRSRFGMD